MVPIYQHTRCNVLEDLRGHKIETCTEYLNSSEHGFEDVRMFQTAVYFVKSKKDIILKNWEEYFYEQ